MSKKKKSVDIRQMNLIFSYLEPEASPSPGSLNISMRFRQAISDGIDLYTADNPGKGRIDICTAIYKLTGIEVPKSTLDGWSAESRDRTSDSIDLNGNKRWGMAGEIIPAFCMVVNYFEPLFVLLEPCNYKAMKGKDVVRARVGLLKEEITKKGKELKELEKALIKTRD